MTLTHTDQPGRMPVHVEVARADELPEAVAAPERPVEAAIARKGDGTFDGPGAARLAGQRGGQARRGSDALADSSGLSRDATDPYRRRAKNWRRKQVAHIRQRVGGGDLSPGVRAIIKVASLQLAGAEKSFDEGDVMRASQLGDSARQNVLAAFELAAKEAPKPQNRTAAALSSIRGGAKT